MPKIYDTYDTSSTSKVVDTDTKKCVGVYDFRSVFLCRDYTFRVRSSKCGIGVLQIRAPSTPGFLQRKQDDPRKKMTDL